MAKAGRPSGTKSNKNWISKGVRLSKEECDKLDKIAEETSKELLLEVNTSAVIRKAILEFIKKYEKE